MLLSEIFDSTNHHTIHQTLGRWRASWTDDGVRFFIAFTPTTDGGAFQNGVYNVVFGPDDTEIADRPGFDRDVDLLNRAKSALGVFSRVAGYTHSFLRQAKPDGIALGAREAKRRRLYTSFANRMAPEATRLGYERIDCVDTIYFLRQGSDVLRAWQERLAQDASDSRRARMFKLSR